MKKIKLSVWWPIEKSADDVIGIKIPDDVDPKKWIEENKRSIILENSYDLIDENLDEYIKDGTAGVELF